MNAETKFSVKCFLMFKASLICWKTSTGATNLHIINFIGEQVGHRLEKVKALVKIKYKTGAFIQLSSQEKATDGCRDNYND